MYDYRQPIRIVRGTTNGFTVTVTDEDGNPYTLQTGEYFRFGVKEMPTDTQYLFTKTISEANEDDEYAFAIDPDDTINLPFGSYWYDIGLQSGSNYFNIIPASAFEIAYNVTKWEA